MLLSRQPSPPGRFLIGLPRNMHSGLQPESAKPLCETSTKDLNPVEAYQHPQSRALGATIKNEAREGTTKRPESRR